MTELNIQNCFSETRRPHTGKECHYFNTDLFTLHLEPVTVAYFLNKPDTAKHHLGAYRVFVSEPSGRGNVFLAATFWSEVLRAASCHDTGLTHTHTLISAFPDLRDSQKLELAWANAPSNQGWLEFLARWRNIMCFWLHFRNFSISRLPSISNVSSGTEPNTKLNM